MVSAAENLKWSRYRFGAGIDRHRYRNGAPDSIFVFLIYVVSR